eukprot:CAMPEP_0183328296 /NCGR_PEP_ID=MMETSP0160_2-20130417/84207_1 /TAXON_ID=2839 ORGANISM="Odontella Sinensis, Strain Grunow 1884" /NCGR_SAMPLE_ID=MMETSP0160_2 /ASSEMBLY_ACC=CAM_ASM_000250 /LENGTH=255 /DNA_ID=CAMNT_0025496455 /DNA_START=77 /DNA_END=844 /DNA_ORIENTATION=-
MRVALHLLAGLAAASAFTSSSRAAFRPSKASSPLSMSTEEAAAAAAAGVPIVITGNNVEVTPAMNDYVMKKLERTVGKLASSGAVKDCDVHLTVNKNPKVKNAHRAEVVTSLKGTVIRCAEDSPDMYASIDAVSDRLARKLKRYKERRLDGWHGGPHIGENMAEVLDSLDTVEEATTDVEAVAAAEDFVDPEAPKVTKIKSYDLSRAVSLQEAIFALDYIDHDFYVFRNEEDNQINVVYKRNAGGVGLIQPAGEE